MMFLRSIFILLTTDLLLTGKGFGVLRACNGCYQPTILHFLLTLEFLSFFDFDLKLNLSHGRLHHQPGHRLGQVTYEQSSIKC